MSSQPRRRRLEVEHIGDVTIVNFVDRKILDEQNIQKIGEDLFSLVDDEGARKVLLNFGNVEFLSSAALGNLITLNKKLMALKGEGGQLTLWNIGPQLRVVFEITKLDKFFNIMPSSGEDDTDGNMGGVTARLKPPKPSGGGAVSLQPPGPEGDD